MICELVQLQLGCSRYLDKTKIEKLLFHISQSTTTLLQLFYGPLVCVWDYPGEPVPER